MAKAFNLIKQLLVYTFQKANTQFSLEGLGNPYLFLIFPHGEHITGRRNRKESDEDTDKMAAMSESLSLEMSTSFISKSKRRRY
jgi:hypothetical protein